MKIPLVVRTTMKVEEVEVEEVVAKRVELAERANRRVR